MRLSSNLKFVVAISTLVLATATLSTSVQANNGFYQVTDVEVSDSLNIRSGAGVSYPVIGSIPPNGRTIMTTGNTEQVGNSMWSEVVWLGQIGWVNSRYLTTGNQQMAPQPVHSRKKPAQENYNYQANDANAHTHPANRCTRTISHTHPNGAGQHKHHYSCEPNSAKAVAAPAPVPVHNANSHTHPRNECTNSITHTHPNGAGAHEHHYSCKSAQTMSRPKYNPNPQPKYIQYNN